MNRSMFILVLALLFSLAHIYSLGRASEERAQLQQADLNGFIVPSGLVKVSALEFDGLASDLLFLKAVMFLAKAGESNSQIRGPEWRWVYSILDTATDLDPYFLDPYYVANAYFTGSAGMVREANALLEKGYRAREWDWLIPLFIGFNNFYYLNDNQKASEYLMQAARRPGPARYMLANLASKLAFKERRTENAIAFLEEIYKSTVDEAQKKRYETRLLFLNNLLKIEKAVAFYRQKFRKAPHSLDVLIQKGLLKELPQDPFGGKFYIDPQGVVRSTSDYLLLPHQRK